MRTAAIMGRPYDTELRELPGTYEAAVNDAGSNLSAGVRASARTGLIAIASGGTGAAAHLFAWLHQRYAGHLSAAVTPLVFENIGAAAARNAVWLLSASGKNVDIIRAFEAALEAEPPELGVLTARAKSPLMSAAAGRGWVRPVLLGAQRARDGFLATNSLLAFCAALAQAYSREFDSAAALPGSLQHLMEEVTPGALRANCTPALARRTVIVLHGATTHVGAFDLESRFTEGALGGVQLADYRNFAHGRHHWLAKRGSDTGVLALVGDADVELAGKTLSKLPANTAIGQVRLRGNPVHAQLRSIVASMWLAQIAGELAEIDPGRPGVPEFGSQLYHLRTRGRRPEAVTAAAIRRKRAAVVAPSDEGESDWAQRLSAFVEKVRGARFAAVVLDYDGTLVDSSDRFSGVRAAVQSQLRRLLRAGVPIGIATGRGRSVREDLRKKLPEDVWPLVFVGYYNGAETAALSAAEGPPRADAVCDALAPAKQALEALALQLSALTVTYRTHQITIESKRANGDGRLWCEVAAAVTAVAPACRVVRSSHSIDVIPRTVSKVAVMSALRRARGLEDNAPILCVGDKGHWPGNDYELLSHEFALSVEDVSADTRTCWNLAPSGHRGVDVTVSYLKSLRVVDHSATLDVSALLSAGAKR